MDIEIIQRMKPTLEREGFMKIFKYQFLIASYQNILLSYKIKMYFKYEECGGMNENSNIALNQTQQTTFTESIK